jgi:hypothetical protein
MVDDITRKQRELAALAERFERLNSFNAELGRATKRKPFQIASALVWDAVRSMRRMFIIDLAEWVGSLHAEDGKWLRRTFQGAVLGRLRSSKKLAAKLAAESKIIGAREHEVFYRKHHATTILEQRSAALGRLFGKEAAARGAATPADVGRLAKRLERWSTALHELRNVHAHAYGLRVGSVRQIGLTHLAKRIAYCGRLLNDFRLLLSHSHYGVPPLGPSAGDENCRDLVDLLVVGTIQFAVEEWEKGSDAQYLWQKRDEHYARMHGRRRKKKSDSFNIAR